MGRFCSVITAVLGLRVDAVSDQWPLASSNTSCDTVGLGYRCDDAVSHSWGQYSPYFSVPSAISANVPTDCIITFAQVLSRHGARDPTAGKTAAYADLVDRIHAGATFYSAGYEFIRTYNYTLGADQLTTFGQQEMVKSGVKFFNRYATLARTNTPFFRSSSEDRVVESAQNFSQGFHQARLTCENTNLTSYPYPIVVLSEASGSNNTLNHDLCTAFETGPYSNVGSSAQAMYAAIFAASVADKLSENLPGVNFSTSDAISFMDLCPFDTVASVNGTVSAFCSLFTPQEWQKYGYYQSLGKWYGYGPGNPLGPTQGIGFAAELIARMTANSSYVTDAASYTSINHILDADNASFPLGADVPLYADFSHDNDLTSIFSALGLFNATRNLSNQTVEDEAKTNGYSAAWTVPFGARAYFEKMQCPSQPEELVRVLVNDRVVPLTNCGADELGRCTLSKFVESLSFVTNGGLWLQCFT